MTLDVFSLRWLLPCGEGGIRTPGTFDSTPDFESGTLNRSDTSPLININALTQTIERESNKSP
jgi:hypothetical protein